MTLETFFKKFDTFADAPNAVAKMRELVLALAIQGKLVEQDATDESAEKLLARIRAQRQQDASEEGSRAIKPLPPISRDEIPSELPSGWVWERLGNIGYTNIGLTYSPQDVGSDGVPVMRSSNIQNGRIDLSDLVRVAVEPKQSVMVEVGDLLICARNGSRALVGKTALIEQLTEPTAFGAFMAIFRSDLNKYIYHFICSPLFRRVIAEVNTTTINQITQGNLRSTLVPIPPLAEQKRIVAKVDELMALCDRLEAEQQERQQKHAALARASLARFAEAPTPANLNLLFHPSYTIPPTDLRKSILTLAVQGKLIPYSSAAGEQTVGDHIEFLNGYAFKSEWFKPSGTRLCRNANVSHGVLDWKESVFVDGEITKEFERFKLNEGDIVLSLDRPLIATGLKVARMRKSDLPCLLLQRVAKPVPKHDQLDLSYFLMWLNSPQFVDTIDPGRSNGVPHISTRQVQSLPFTLPPLAEQRRIVAKVDELMALVDALETQLATDRTSASHLLDAVVAELTSAT